jgi:hypothetical protein
VCAIAACVAASVPAVAQDRQPSGGPFSGLLRGSPKDQPHTLDLRASAFTAWDDNLLAQTPTAGGGLGAGPGNIDPRFIQPGIANGFQGSLTYGFRKIGTRSQFTFNGDTSAQQFASGLGDPLRFYSYNVSTNLRTSLTNKTSMSFGAGTAYAPFYQYAPFLKNTTSEESPVGSDYGYAVQAAQVRSAVASLSVENRLTKKSSISAGIGWERQVIPGTADANVIQADPNVIQLNDATNIDRRIAQATFTHSLTRKLAFHVGYGIQESRYLSRPDIDPVRTNSIDIGLGYGDGLMLRLGRHTTLGLSIGASIAKNGDPALVASTGKETAFVVNGSATLSRSIGQTWGASLGYLRGTSYVVGFTEPVMTDTANAGIGGPLSSRLQFSAGAGASRGQQLFSVSHGSIVSYTASTRLTFAAFSHLALYGQASYYRFSIPSGYTNFGFVPDLDRRSVSVGLTTWLPLIKQRRTRRDAGQTPTGQP